MGDGATLISPDGEPIESAERFRERVRREERRDLIDWLKWRARGVLGPRMVDDGSVEYVMDQVIREVIVEIERGSHAR